MQLVLNTFGAYISKNGDCFEIRVDDKKQEISCKKVDSILIATAATITTDAIKLAVDNNIDIVFLDKFGEPYGRVWHPKLGSTTMIRRIQLQYSMIDKGLEFVKDWIQTKLDNQIEFLEKLLKYREDKGEPIKTAIEQMTGIKLKMLEIKGTLDECRGSFMGYEGSAGRIYFETINYVTPDKYKFDGRSKMPAKDEFNALINYGYGVLYSLVEKACIIAGLDPYVGFLHTDNYNKKSLVFDIIELFRIHIDKCVVYLFTGKRINDSFFDKIKNGVTLNKEGKQFYIAEINKIFDDSIRYRGRNIKVKDTIQFECHRIAQELLKSERIQTADYADYADYKNKN